MPTRSVPFHSLPWASSRRSGRGSPQFGRGKPADQLSGRDGFAEDSEWPGRRNGRAVGSAELQVLPGELDRALAIGMEQAHLLVPKELEKCDSVVFRGFVEPSGFPGRGGPAAALLQSISRHSGSSSLWCPCGARSARRRFPERSGIGTVEERWISTLRGSTSASPVPKTRTLPVKEGRRSDAPENPASSREILGDGFRAGGPR